MFRLWSARVIDEFEGKHIAQELLDRSLMGRDERRRYRSTIFTWTTSARWQNR
jgi:hypothetical protein